MESNARLYHCACCHQQVIICRHCDRGNIYCRSCALRARQKSLRQAGTRYQKTKRGQKKHAARQRAYRQRQKEKGACVTHQGSPTTTNNDSLCAGNHQPPVTECPNKVTRLYCHFCKKPCDDFLRSGFLPHDSDKQDSIHWPLVL